MSALPGVADSDLVRTFHSTERPQLVRETLVASVLRSATADLSHPHDFTADLMVADADGVWVAMNGVAVLRRELHRRSWRHSTVAIGVSGADPYGWCEDRYRLMPGVIAALAESRTPFLIRTGSGGIVRDLSLLRAVGREVPTTVVMTLPCLDDTLGARADPGGMSAAVRLDALGQLAEAGLDPQVLIGPILPCLTDSSSQLDDLLATVAAAGATRVSLSVFSLDEAGDYLDWIGWEHPALLRRYRALYGRGLHASADYMHRLRDRMAPLVERHRLARQSTAGVDPELTQARSVSASASELLTLF